MKKLNNIQLQKLSDIFILIGGIVFGSTVIPFFVKFDKPGVVMLISGLLLSIFCWLFSLFIVKGVRR
ncbi:hypothetical protein A3F00_01295 [Candidatus Daviesbacteria bacterium RIFCSPHIGHO2_12_FULL_37_11]|uniref:Uncharacterized protein n=1 Tax=Candidatus Daviesbacteria bacterium RIFCSPHIGHO2_12_FULL_37_11 TaxID=1797777 RepID=A0A1F5K964_9BACT|nr:MAG: hypothetical protein A3F00_01295 [Candidatus Daviesbacteria bacterium RIFCSPHIGHO2_12_FULL_37_11]OGE46008.1 MAG: hypothetical protein A3B39_04365 [Candidatus Daviesbacteria bacterium RIFCSPLOWO2_01_FULL_37_10]